jgi:hypothetical protein
MKKILTCFIIYRNAILTFLTLFVKYVFEKKLKFYIEKNEIEKRLRDSPPPSLSPYLSLAHRESVL